MAKKYIADYTLQEVTDPAGGKSRQVPVYSGPLFRFLLAGKELTAAKRVFSLLTILSAAGVAASLMTNAPCARKWYVMFPLALSLLPLFLQGESCFLFWRAKEPLKREQRDKIEKRTVVTAAFSAFLSAFSLGFFSCRTYSFYAILSRVHVRRGLSSGGGGSSDLFSAAHQAAGKAEN